MNPEQEKGDDVGNNEGPEEADCAQIEEESDKRWDAEAVPCEYRNFQRAFGQTWLWCRPGKDRNPICGHVARLKEAPKQDSQAIRSADKVGPESAGASLPETG